MRLEVLVSIVFADALVLKHQVIAIHNADKTLTVFNLYRKRVTVKKKLLNT